MTGMPDALRQAPYLAKLDPTLLKEPAERIHERNYRGGEVILLEGERCKGLDFVVSVRVKVFKLELPSGVLISGPYPYDRRPSVSRRGCQGGQASPGLDLGTRNPRRRCWRGASARLTQHQIAAMTVSVGRVAQHALKSLERDFPIKLEQARVVILDPKALERWGERGPSPSS